MILFALEQALDMVSNEGDHNDCDDNNSNDCSDPSWSNEISVRCVDAAATIMDHLIQQKLIMVDLTEVPQSNGANGTATTSSHITHASTMTRGHISEPVLGKYKVGKALELFDVAHTYSFGSTIDQVTPRRKVKFRKTPYDLLTADGRSVLRDMRITEDEYCKVSY